MDNSAPIYFDIETTGLDIREDRIVEIAAYCNGSKFSSLVNPSMPIPESSRSIHGISDEMVSSSPSFRDVGQSFIEFCCSCSTFPVIIAHNGDNFDFPFLKHELERNDTFIPHTWKFIDSIKWAKKFRPDIGKYSLQFLREVFDIPPNTAHRALDDTMVLKGVFEALVGNLSLSSILELILESQEEPTDKMPFGKHQGKNLKDVPKNYVRWLLSSGALDKQENQSLKDKLKQVHGDIFATASISN